MTIYTTIQINEVETEVLVSFEVIHGVADICSITTVDGTTVAIDPDKSLYEECEEYAADYAAEKRSNGRFGR